jgi:tetratricopeptide (TPR) repeat protein
MKRFLVFSGLIVLSASLGSPAMGDIVRLKDGSRIEGEIRRTADGWDVTGVDGKVTRVTADRVAGIDIKPISSPDAAKVRLNSLRHAAENLGDIKQIISRYQTFIDQNKGTPAAEEAKADLDLWHQRQAQGLVKAGGQWVTPKQRNDIQSKSIDVAIHIHDLLKQNQLNQASKDLDKALAADPQSTSLLYLRGVIQYVQEKLPPARKTFEEIIKTLPDHAPTLNNLAVILWRQKAWGGALALYDKALLAAPDSREVLDNIAEALNSLPPEQQKNPVAERLGRHYREREAALEQRMAQKGLYRWGSTWLDEQAMKKVQDDTKAVRDQMAKMDADYKAMQLQMADLTKRADTVQQTMRYMEQQSYAQGPDGTLVQYPLPAPYYQFAQELAGIRQQQNTIRANADRMRAQAKDVQNKLPKPTYSGIQRPIDADGMPLPAPTSQPAVTLGPPKDAPTTQPAIAWPPGPPLAPPPSPIPAATQPPMTQPTMAAAGGAASLPTAQRGAPATQPTSNVAR